MAIVFFCLFGFMCKQWEKEQKRDIEEYKKMYPELEALGKLYEKEDFDKRTESVLLAQHHLRCCNIEALRQNMTTTEFHYKRYKEEHAKNYGY